MQFSPYDFIELIKEKCSNEEEYVDCLLDILHLNAFDLKATVDAASDELDRMGRCKNCGTKLEIMTYREYHSEVDAFEPMSDIYCPECDMG